MRESIFNAANSTFQGMQRFISDALYLVTKRPELATALCLYSLLPVAESLLIFFTSDESLPEGGIITMCPAGVVIHNEGFEIDPNLADLLYEKCGLDRREPPPLFRVWNCLRSATTLFMLNPNTQEPLAKTAGKDLCDGWKYHSPFMKP